MANNGKVTFTYRENVSTPEEVSEWLRAKPESISYPNWLNAAILAYQKGEAGEPVDLAALTEAIGTGGRPQGSAAAVSGGAGIDEIRTAIQSDGGETRQVMESVSEQIASLKENLGDIASMMQETETREPQGTAEPSAPMPDMDALGELVRGIVSAENDATRQRLESIVQGIQPSTASDDSGAEAIGKHVDEAMGRIHDELASIKQHASEKAPVDSQLGSQDLEKVVSRLKDSIITDGQKTRNALQKGEAPLTRADLDDVLSAMHDEQQGIKEELRQSTERIANGQNQNIVFDEATAKFFGDLHRGVAGILARIDAMQLQLDQIEAKTEDLASRPVVSAPEPAHEERKMTVAEAQAKFAPVSKRGGDPLAEVLAADPSVRFEGVDVDMAMYDDNGAISEDFHLPDELLGEYADEDSPVGASEMPEDISIDDLVSVPDADAPSDETGTFDDSDLAEAENPVPEAPAEFAEGLAGFDFGDEESTIKDDEVTLSDTLMTSLVSADAPEERPVTESLPVLMDLIGENGSLSDVTPEDGTPTPEEEHIVDSMLVSQKRERIAIPRRHSRDRTPAGWLDSSDIQQAPQADAPAPFDFGATDMTDSIYESMSNGGMDEAFDVDDHLDGVLSSLLG